VRNFKYMLNRNRVDATGWPCTDMTCRLQLCVHRRNSCEHSAIMPTKRFKQTPNGIDDPKVKINPSIHAVDVDVVVW
jgi:hypothetical protein